MSSYFTDAKGRLIEIKSIVDARNKCIANPKCDGITKDDSKNAWKLG